MKALEFQTTLTTEPVLTIPPELRTELKDGVPVRVILLFPETTENADWARLTAEQFLQGYAERDSVYDKL
ncbi:MAG: hypothetical protein N2559_17895 [Anaerolineae bacterium]|nr:hypothetical protein [Anaerolineae bacterium]